MNGALPLWNDLLNVSTVRQNYRDLFRPLAPPY